MIRSIPLRAAIVATLAIGPRRWRTRGWRRDQPGLRRRRQQRRATAQRFHRTVQRGHRAAEPEWLVGAIRLVRRRDWNNATALPNLTLQPGQYLLIQEGAGSGGGANLPTADVTGAIAMSGTAGKVALVNSTTSLSGACPSSDASVVDFIGYGAAASCAEGSATADLSNTTAALRALDGCADSDDNSADFTLAAPAPRNSSTSLNACAGSGGITLSIADVSIAEGDSGSSDAFFTVTLSQALKKRCELPSRHRRRHRHGRQRLRRARKRCQHRRRRDDLFVQRAHRRRHHAVAGRNLQRQREQHRRDGVTTTAATATGTIVNDDPLHIYDLAGRRRALAVSEYDGRHQRRSHRDRRRRLLYAGTRTATATRILPMRSTFLPATTTRKDSQSAAGSA